MAAGRAPATPMCEVIFVVRLTGKQAADYFRRCFGAVDGLWCMKVEERYGFEVALDVDRAVWEVFPKIQARKLKELTGLGNGLEALKEAYTTKLELEDYEFVVEDLPGGGFSITLSECPWHGVMLRSGRGHLSGRVGSTICPTEYGVWAAEFGPGITWEQDSRICEGDQTCTIRFKPA